MLDLVFEGLEAEVMTPEKTGEFDKKVMKTLK
jgi:hypothetical protein